MCVCACECVKGRERVEHIMGEAKEMSSNFCKIEQKSLHAIALKFDVTLARSFFLPSEISN